MSLIRSGLSFGHGDNITRPHGQGIKIATPSQQQNAQRIKDNLIILSNVADEHFTIATRRRYLQLKAVTKSSMSSDRKLLIIQINITVHLPHSRVLLNCL